MPGRAPGHRRTRPRSRLRHRPASTYCTPLVSSEIPKLLPFHRVLSRNIACFGLRRWFCLPLMHSTASLPSLATQGHGTAETPSHSHAGRHGHALSHALPGCLLVRTHVARHRMVPQHAATRAAATSFPLVGASQQAFAATSRLGGKPPNHCDLTF
jgi:hypothetical protein